jgi:ABC-type polysaccharide/polyol phosphate transport system ATPase subunit
MKIITLDRVSKRYRLSRLGSRSIREELVRTFTKFRPGHVAEERRDEFYALREMSLQIERGETVGFIGPNGSGKSTLLKLLSRIIYPTSGKIIVNGSVASLIEVGAGFHPELTGRDNIYLYGSIMGMKRAEVRQKFDRIVEFAEMARFLDTPVKHYSSGMYVRLGFAVAAHINPQVLLVDEVLAVGDAAFQSKCQQRIEELRRGGMTIFFVSHDMAAVERLCDRVYFLQQGQVRSVGEPQQVIHDYYNAVLFRHAPSSYSEYSHIEAQLDSGDNGTRAAEIRNVRFFNCDGQETDTISTGEPLIARIEYTAYQTIEDPVFELLFYSAEGHLHTHYTTAINGDPIPMLQGSGAVEITCEEFGLMPGLFKIDALLVRRGAIDAYDRKLRQYMIKVMPGRKVRGMFYSPHQWRLLPADEIRRQSEAAAEQRYL